MKNYLIIVILFLCCVNLSAQTKLWGYEDGQGTDGEFIFRDFEFDKFGNTFALGQGAVGIQLLKLDSTGNLKKKTTVPTAWWHNYSFVKSIFLDSQGNIYVQINDLDNNHNLATHLIKYDIDLNILFNINRAYGQLFDTITYCNDYAFADLCLGFGSIYICYSSTNCSRSIIYRLDQNSGAVIDSVLLNHTIINDATINNSGLIVTGSKSNNINGKQLLVQQFDSLLTSIWICLYNNTLGNYMDEGNELKMSNNNIYVAGLSQNSTSTYGVLAKINSLGNIQWSRKLVNGATSYDCISFDVDKALDHCYVLTGQNRILKYNPYGTRLFDKPILDGVFASICTNATSATPASLLMLAGYVEPTSGKIYRKGVSAFLNPVDATKLHYFKWGNNLYSPIYGVFQNTLGKVNNYFSPPRYCVIGNGKKQYWDGYFPRYRHIACYDATVNNAKLVQSESVETIGKLLVYPNPTTSLATIEFESTTECEGQLTIIDMMGKKVYNKVVKIEGGKNSLVLDLSNIVSGIYSVQLNYSGLTFYQNVVVQ